MIVMILIEADNLKQSADELIDFSISKGPINLWESFWEEYVKRKCPWSQAFWPGEHCEAEGFPFCLSNRGFEEGGLSLFQYSVAAT